MAARAAALAIAASLASACGGTDRGTRADDGSRAGAGGRAAELRVSAAVSLTEALHGVAKAFEQRTGTRVSLNLAGSNTLATQIVEGAAVDVFVSADAAQMDRVARAGALLPSTRVDIVSNQLVVIVPADAAAAGASLAAPSGASSSAPARPAAASPANVSGTPASASTAAGADAASRGTMPQTTPTATPVTATHTKADELLRPALRRIAIGDPAAVPAGVYARQYLERAGLWHALQPKIVPLPHVRAVLTAVATGAADAGIVYRTDAATSTAVRIAWTVPSGDAPAIVYPAAVIRSSAQPDRARAFVEFLRTPEAAALFTAAGFTPR